MADEKLLLICTICVQKFSKLSYLPPDVVVKSDSNLPFFHLYRTSVQETREVRPDGQVCHHGEQAQPVGAAVLRHRPEAEDPRPDAILQWLRGGYDRATEASGSISGFFINICTVS